MDNKEIKNMLNIIGIMVVIILVLVLGIAYKLKIFWWQ